MLTYGELTPNPWSYIHQPGVIPPPRFDHPFKGKVIVENGGTETICPGHPACTFGNHNGVCRIFINPRYDWMRDVLMRHEIAHCNGWPGDHPS